MTQGAYISPEVLDQYHLNILKEDELVTKALSDLGMTCVRVAWDDPDYDWSSAKYALIRATWDYFHRIDEFKAWLDRVATQAELINTYETLMWNLDKHYLQDCLDAGVNIPKTKFIERGEQQSLSDRFHDSGWQKAVLKPCISGAARHTYVIDSHNVAEYDLLLQELIRKESMMLQEFQESVPLSGEITLVLIGGKYTHAVLKRAKEGDFRVQDDFGGTVHHHVATGEEIRFAELAMGRISPVPLYGRVDIVRDNEGQLALQELELIEPELWFRYCPEAAKVLAEEIKKLAYS